MANREHLEILKQGVEVWNKWREANREIRPDLSGHRIENENLGSRIAFKVKSTGKGYEYVRLVIPDFSEVSFVKTFLHHVQLGGANLVGADFNGATLNGVGLVNADLTRANFLDALLYSTNLFGASLAEADFTGAILEYASFGNNDLSRVKWLEMVKHRGPSSIGIDTIYKSRGEIPELFMRGCGVPEDFITYARSFTARPIQFYSCFISYSSKDQDFATRLYADLQNRGVRCWFAPEDLKIGDKIRDSIDESIRLRDKLLLILSEHSIESEWVEQEVESALEEERRRGRTVLFPVRIDDAVMESKKGWASHIRNTRHIGDFTKWKEHGEYQKAFDRLLRDLKAGE